jgi:hypothetical protein
LKAKSYKLLALKLILMLLNLNISGKIIVFENRVLGRIFGPKVDATIRGWRKLHNEELKNL